ncbi:MAG: stage III sporulation protein AC [Ruminococcaceae bacterium]|nr:stage III sporulation protein AC [Oscillospiraceae bacterium]
MDIGFIFKIGAIGIIIAVINTLLIRSGREDQAMLTTLAGVIVVLMMIIPKIAELFSSVRSLFDI